CAWTRGTTSRPVRSAASSTSWPTAGSSSAPAVRARAWARAERARLPRSRWTPRRRPRSSTRRPSSGGPEETPVRLTVRLFASLRERVGRECIVLENVPAGSDVAAAKRLLESRHPELGSLQAVRGVLGTSYVPDTSRLAEGAELALLPPVSGGSGSGESVSDDATLARGVFELSGAPLDVAAVQRRVEHSSCGAVVVFTGNARERNRERDVVRLDYEAFPAMAESEMAHIFEDCRARIAGDAGHALRML